MAFCKYPERLSDMVSLKITPSMRTWLESLEKKRKCGLNVIIREILETKMDNDILPREEAAHEDT